jgi:hypothetical protein
MKKYFVVTGGALLVILGIVLYRWANAVPHPEQISAQPNPSIQTSVQASTAPERQLPGGPYVSSDPRWATVREKDKSDHNWEWRMPINFYGCVVDQNEQPVSAAKIHAQWSDFSPNGASTEDTLSDEKGCFSIIGKTGRGITIRVEKKDYYTPTRQQTSFDYAAFWEATYYEPNPARPVTFHLRKKGAGESLAVGEMQQLISANGTPVRLDVLNSGRMSPMGQIEIAAETNTEKYPPRRFNWRASITVPNGGLSEHNLEFPFEAPEDSYQRTVEFVMPEASLDWQRAIEKNYFIRFGTPPIYGRIHIRFNGASQRAYLRYAINPTGSRNLEPSTDEQFSQP